MDKKSVLPKVMGAYAPVQLATGETVPIVKLNNAATTPPFVATMRAVTEFLGEYGAFHRGAGPHATKTYERVHEALRVIRKFLNLRKDQALLFRENTSGAINLFARMLRLTRDDVVLTSAIEHTSDNLPWRYNTHARVVEARAFDDGSMDENDVERLAQKYAGRLKVVAMTGASNQTGYIPDIRRLASIVHEHGALLFIDAAQLAPHRKIDVRKLGIDALAFSAHKLYAPFGLGVLVLPKAMLETEPVDPAGGSLAMISDESIIWAPSDERHQTGTWNVTGIIALAASCQEIVKTGWPAIVSHEHTLALSLRRKLEAVPHIQLFAKRDMKNGDWIGEEPFGLPGFHHEHVVAIADHEYGIELRGGEICNHRLVRRWAGVNDARQRAIERQIRQGNLLASYGVVRASLGIHNTEEDVDRLSTVLTTIQTKGPRMYYRRVPRKGLFVPVKRRSLSL